jgi:hypothetical protein
MGRRWIVISLIETARAGAGRPLAATNGRENNELPGERVVGHQVNGTDQRRRRDIERTPPGAFADRKHQRQTRRADDEQFGVSSSNGAPAASSDRNPPAPTLSRRHKRIALDQRRRFSSEQWRRRRRDEHENVDDSGRRHFETSAESSGSPTVPGRAPQSPADDDAGSDNTAKPLQGLAGRGNRPELEHDGMSFMAASPVGPAEIRSGPALGGRRRWPASASQRRDGNDHQPQEIKLPLGLSIVLNELKEARQAPGRAEPEPAADYHKGHDGPHKSFPLLLVVAAAAAAAPSSWRLLECSDLPVRGLGRGHVDRPMWNCSSLAWRQGNHTSRTTTPGFRWMLAAGPEPRRGSLDRGDAEIGGGPRALRGPQRRHPKPTATRSLSDDDSRRSRAGASENSSFINDNKKQAANMSRGGGGAPL